MTKIPLKIGNQALYFGKKVVAIGKNITRKKPLLKWLKIIVFIVIIVFTIFVLYKIYNHAN